MPDVLQSERSEPHPAFGHTWREWSNPQSADADDADVELVGQDDIRLRPDRERKHSGLGIASFIIAVLVIGLDVVLGVAITVRIARSSSGESGVEDLRDAALSGGIAMFCLNCMNVPLCLVGVGLAVTGLIANRGCNHVFSWIGLLGNGVIILAVIGLYVFGAMTDTQRKAGLTPHLAGRPVVTHLIPHLLDEVGNHLPRGGRGV
jgi:hypothetical protein